jgi:hypothetical protein
MSLVVQSRYQWLRVILWRLCCIRVFAIGDRVTYDGCTFGVIKNLDFAPTWESSTQYPRRRVEIEVCEPIVKTRQLLGHRLLVDHANLVHAP